MIVFDNEDLSVEVVSEFFGYAVKDAEKFLIPCRPPRGLFAELVRTKGYRNELAGVFKVCRREKLEEDTAASNGRSIAANKKGAVVVRGEERDGGGACSF